MGEVRATPDAADAAAAAACDTMEGAAASSLLGGALSMAPRMTLITTVQAKDTPATAYRFTRCHVRCR